MKLSAGLIALSLIVSGAPAGAADPHIHTVYYEPDTVIDLKGAVGWQILIEFGPDERIENVSIGDSTAWQVAPNKRAQMLFLKPLSANASTNMTVITSARQYAFNLSVAPRQNSTPWIVRFDYPLPPAPPEPQTPSPSPPAPPPIELNFAYVRSGDPTLLPSRVWDDGRQTYFEFAEDTAIPAIFAGGPKDESLVNVTMRDRVAVVQQRAERFTLRAGKRVAAVIQQP